MDSAVVLAQLLLAAVFITAGVGKLLDLPGSQRALAGFGVPAGLARIGGTVLPFVELATAAALLTRPTAQWGGVAALVLMLTFIGGIANAMARGQAPDCNCFGALHSASAGWTALLRNAVLAALAALVAVWGPDVSITSWLADRGADEILAVAAGVLAVAAVPIALRMWWDNRQLRSELSQARASLAAVPPGLPAGALAPDFAVEDADGHTVSLHELCAQGLPVALVFVRAGCGPSESLLPEVHAWRERLAGRITIGTVGEATVARYTGRSPGIPLQEAMERDTVLRRDMDDLLELYEAYRLEATPSAVVVTPEGTIASATVDGRPAIEALLRLTLARSNGGTAPRALRPAAA